MIKRSFLCSGNDPKSKTFTSPNQQFEIMDFMISENVEFKNLLLLKMKNNCFIP
jgi:hypothetical protein